MVECPECGFVAKTPAGLKVHQRRKHQDAPQGSANVAALEKTLAEMERLRWFEKIDAARVQTLRSLAAAVDADPFNAQMWRQYREALTEVMKADDEADDSLAAALAEIRSAT